jgi:prefoldin subunit 5
MPTDFSHSSSRKARFKALFNQYEDEISRLIKQIDALNNEITELKVFLEKVIIIYFNN